MDDQKLPKRLCEYVTYLKAVRDLSPLSVGEYKRDLTLFFEFLLKKRGLLKNDDAKGDLSIIDDEMLGQVTLFDIHEFLAECSENNTSVTRARKASSLRGFFKYISDKMGYIEKNCTSELSVSPSKRKLPKYLTLEQSRALLNSVAPPNFERDFCILTLFLNCGLRLSELCGLNVTDFNLDEKTLRVTGKGNKQRMIYLNEACITAICAYLAVRPAGSLKDPDSKKAMFISRLNKRMGRQAVQQMVYKYLEKIGLNGDHYSVHKLRHTAATLLYQYGDVDVLLIKDMLGHENLSTTEIYTHIENKQLREAVKKNPLNTSDEKKEDPSKA